ncbi:hypothetical protein ACFUPX_23220, partial [Streptomyces sp. NPDC057302]
MRRTTTVAVLAASPLLTLTACGGGDDSEVELKASKSTECKLRPDDAIGEYWGTEKGVGRVLTRRGPALPAASGRGFAGQATEAVPLPGSNPRPGGPPGGPQTAPPPG